MNTYTVTEAIAVAMVDVREKKAALDRATARLEELLALVNITPAQAEDRAILRRFPAASPSYSRVEK